MTFFWDYTSYKHALLRHKFLIIVPAFLIAMGMNTLLFTDAGHRVQSSIVNYQWAVESNMSVTVDQNLVGSIRSNTTFNNIDALHVTLLFDPDALFLDQITSDIPGASIIVLTDTSPQTLSISFSEPTTIEANANILDYQIIKLTTEPRNINLSSVYFEKEWVRYELSSTGSDLF